MARHSDLCALGVCIALSPVSMGNILPIGGQKSSNLLPIREKSF
jgi:hypothetical protein